MRERHDAAFAAGFVEIDELVSWSRSLALWMDGEMLVLQSLWHALAFCRRCFVATAGAGW